MIPTLGSSRRWKRSENGEDPPMHRSRITVAPTVTDNRGNAAARNKLMTSKYPSSAILMEMSAYMKRMGIKALVEWAPREGNRQADALANRCYDGFNPALRIPVDVRSMKSDALPQALDWGEKPKICCRKPRWKVDC